MIIDEILLNALIPFFEIFPKLLCDFIFEFLLFDSKSIEFYGMEYFDVR